MKHHPVTRSLYESDWLSNEDVYVNHRKRCQNAFKKVLPENKAFIPGQLSYRFIAEPGFAYEASLGKLGRLGSVVFCGTRENRMPIAIGR